MYATMLSMALLGCVAGLSGLTEPQKEVIKQKEIIKSEVSTDIAFEQSLDGGRRYNNWLNRSRSGYSNYNSSRQGIFSRLRRR